MKTIIKNKKGMVLNPTIIAVLLIVAFIYLGFVRTGDVLASDWEKSKDSMCGVTPAAEIERCTSWTICSINDPTENINFVTSWFEQKKAEGYGGCQLAYGEFAPVANAGYKNTIYSCCATSPQSSPAPSTSPSSTTSPVITTAPVYVNGEPAGFLDKLSLWVKSLINKIFGVFN